MTKGLVTNDGIDRQKWQRPFTKGKKASPTETGEISGFKRSVKITYRFTYDLQKSYLLLNVHPVGKDIP